VGKTARSKSEWGGGKVIRPESRVWKPTSEFRSLWEAILEAQPEADVLASSVFLELERSLSAFGLTTAKRRVYTEGNNSSTFFIQWALPIAEYSGWPQFVCTDLPKSLACHILWCWFWRKLDDILDNDFSDPARTFDAVETSFVAMHAHNKLARNKRNGTNRIISRSLINMVEIAKREKTPGVDIQDIWKRASPFLIIPAGILKLEKSKIESYRNLIVIVGLLHDIADFVDDIQRGIRSMPIRWLYEIDQAGEFTLGNVLDLFRLVKQEIGRRLGELEISADPSCIVIRKVLLPSLRKEADRILTFENR
jgi:hypothetical protein